MKRLDAKLLVLGLMVLVAVVVLRPKQAPSTAIRELRREALELRGDVLFVKGEVRAFDGVLFENFTNGSRKLVIEFRNGKAQGHSRGWFEGGQLEVEESFSEGISHGLRTRWHANGQKKAETEIRHGKLAGRYTEWHENGQKAIEMTLVDGQPTGSAEAWHPSGAVKSRTQFEAGKIVDREFYDDTNAPAALAATNP